MTRDTFGGTARHSCATCYGTAGQSLCEPQCGSTRAFVFRMIFRGAAACGDTRTHHQHEVQLEGANGWPELEIAMRIEAPVAVWW